MNRDARRARSPRSPSPTASGSCRAHPDLFEAHAGRQERRLPRPLGKPADGRRRQWAQFIGGSAVPRRPLVGRGRGRRRRTARRRLRADRARRRRLGSAGLHLRLHRPRSGSSATGAGRRLAPALIATAASPRTRTPASSGRCSTSTRPARRARTVCTNGWASSRPRVRSRVRPSSADSPRKLAG